MSSILDYSTLKARQRDERHNYGEHLGLRVHRALSWLNRAELCEDDDDAKVIFLWVAFNAAYANEISPDYQTSEHKLIYQFLKHLCQLDDKMRLENIVWLEFTKSIRALLNNKYIFQPFWEYKKGAITEDHWKLRFENAKNNAGSALGNRDTPRVLNIVLSRIYTLRNQLIHGGSTWNSRTNREQIKDCTRFMECFVPAIIEIMMDNGSALWGQACYPVV
jgi:hypothetical protein